MHREHLLRTIRVNSIVARARAQFMKLHRRRQVAAQQQEEEEEEDGCVDRAVNAIALPLALAMKVSIPDCREERWRSWYFASFTMSIVWIGVLSFLMVDFAARAVRGESGESRSPHAPTRAPAAVLSPPPPRSPSQSVARTGLHPRGRRVPHGPRRTLRRHLGA